MHVPTRATCIDFKDAPWRLQRRQQEQFQAAQEAWRANTAQVVADIQARLEELEEEIDRAATMENDDMLVPTEDGPPPGLEVTEPEASPSEPADKRARVDIDPYFC